MYAKCAAMPHTHRTFDIIPDRDMDLWHTMIDGYSVNGLRDETLRLFELMKECMALLGTIIRGTLKTPNLSW
jgi:pentatricopeptide repeat protein